MTRTRRLSAQAVSVLQALAEQPAVWRHGYELGQEVGLKAGTLYPILIRLHDRGLLEATWESELPSGRPPRHLYRLTGAGAALAATVEAESANGVASRRRGALRRGPGSELRGAW